LALLAAAVFQEKTIRAELLESQHSRADIIVTDMEFLEIAAEDAHSDGHHEEELVTDKESSWKSD